MSMGSEQDSITSTYSAMQPTSSMVSTSAPNSVDSGVGPPQSLLQQAIQQVPQSQAQLMQQAQGPVLQQALTQGGSVHLHQFQATPTLINSNHTPSSQPTVLLQDTQPKRIVTRVRLEELVREVDPTEQIDEDVEDLLLQLADDFVESCVTAACLLAKHRKSSTIEVKDVQLHLERNWNMWIPGFGSDELHTYKKSSTSEAHKQRLSLIRKTLKKY